MMDELQVCAQGGRGEEVYMAVCKQYVLSTPDLPAELPSSTLLT